MTGGRKEAGDRIQKTEEERQEKDGIQMGDGDRRKTGDRQKTGERDRENVCLYVCVFVCDC